MMSLPSPTKITQHGSMMLEALISILIFSIGILAIIGLQAASIKMSSDAKYRSDASFLASQLVAQMWNGVAVQVPATGFNCNANPLNSDAYTGTEFNPYLGNYSGLSITGGAAFSNWASAVVATLPNPSASAVLAAAPTISPSPCVSGLQQSINANAIITISWQLPGGDAHIFSTTAPISSQKLFN